jgi:AcrR family transcriptional regulator
VSSTLFAEVISVTLPPPPWVPRRAAAARSAKPALSRETIVAAALAILDREGPDAMSMRRVAQELDTGAASLYAHVANLRELEDLVLDRVMAEIPLPTVDKARWRHQLKQLLLDWLAVMRRHNGVARFALGRVPVLEHAMTVSEVTLDLLRVGGVPDQQAAWGVDLLTLFVAAATYEVSIGQADGLDGEAARDWYQQYGRYLASLPPDRFRNIVQLAPVMVQGGDQERAEFALDIMLDGLAATARPPRSG